MTIYILGIAHCLGCRFAGAIHTEADSPLNLGSDVSKIDELSEFSSQKEFYCLTNPAGSPISHISKWQRYAKGRSNLWDAVLLRDTAEATAVLRFIQKVTHQS
eukprot:COSAG03_NODE_1745_length_3576_cov_4.681910_6_plen_103_part_00